MTNIENKNPRRIRVNIKDNPYEVVIGEKIINKVGEELMNIGIKEGTKILLITNPVLVKPYGEKVLEALLRKGYDANIFVLEAGESNKTIQGIQKIHDECFNKEIERSSLLIALGGGVIGDMTGFAAATWLRGISFIQIPTSLLAMVDASIGGKTGVNHPLGKNLIGAFHQPKLVLIDSSTLLTLPSREFSAGMAEVIKYGVIKNYELFKLLEQANDLSDIKYLSSEFLLDIIERSVSTKSKVVVEDEKEKGLRAILNYGHTLGHCIETICGYGKWLHGEAVSIGMNSIGKIAVDKGFWDVRDANRQEELLIKAGLPTKWPQMKPEEVVNVIKRDKKVKDGKVNFIMPLEIGKVKIVNDIDLIEINNLLN